MLQYLSSYNGSVIVNGIQYPSVAEADKALATYEGKVIVEIPAFKRAQSTLSQMSVKEVVEVEGTPIYQIKVKQYMTKPASPEFDFQDKFNGGVPMPLRVMTGRKLKETKGMVQMELWGEIVGEQVTSCMKCGRVLTNPVSRYFGLGPECGGHGYTNPFESDDALQAAVQGFKEKLAQVTWTGWVIKSAIEEEEIVRYE